MISNKTNFYGEDFSTPRPTPNLEDHPLSSVRDSLFNIFAAALHIADRSSIRNLRTRYAVVTGTLITAYRCDNRSLFFKLKIVRTDNISNKTRTEVLRSSVGYKPNRYFVCASHYFT